MALEIEEKRRKYLRLTEDGKGIEGFICPVDGCGFTVKSPGALRMHILFNSDPEMKSRYCPKHEKFYRSHLEELGYREVRYLAGFPSVRMHHVNEEGRVEW